MARRKPIEESWQRVFHIAIAVPNVDSHEEDLYHFMNDLTKRKTNPISNWMLLPCHNPEPGATGYIKQVNENRPSPFDERSTVDGIWPFIQPKQYWSVVRVRNSIYKNVEILDVKGSFVKFQGEMSMFEDVLGDTKRDVVCPIAEITLMEGRTS